MTDPETGPAGSDVAPGRLLGAPQPPAARYDVALLDLDGVLYVGPEPVPTAAAALAGARELGMRLAFVTNNASRAPAEVAKRLRAQGVPAEDGDVVTSAQAAGRVLAERFAPGSRVLVVGADALRSEMSAAGLTVVDSADAGPAAVVQGYAADTTYSMLAEAALAVSRGALWVGCNADATIPTPRGLLPGNGALLAVVATATGRQPLIAGKPELALHAESVERTGARAPLVVGDRLDTDIRGARRGGSASLLVLTGVDRLAGLLVAAPGDRPDLVAVDLTGLLEPHAEVLAVRRNERWHSEYGGWSAIAAAGELVLSGSGAGASAGAGAAQPIDLLRVACVAAWAAADAGTPIRGCRSDPAAAQALSALGEALPEGMDRLGS